MKPYYLEGKNILVTGASAGIGRSVSEHLSNQDANVIITARNIIRLNDTLKLLAPGNHTVIQADLSCESGIEILAEKLPQIDGIVLNASMIKTVPVRFVKKSVLDEIFQLNFYSSVLLLQRLLKLKKINEGASVCFISSVTANYVHLGNALYSASKGAVNSFARSLALELAPKQIRVNAILPGMIETGLLEKSPFTEEQINEHRKNYPLGRFGKPEDVAHLVVYLLSDASSWMTGTLLTIDGGYSLK